MLTDHILYTKLNNLHVSTDSKFIPFFKNIVFLHNGYLVSIVKRYVTELIIF